MKIRKKTQVNRSSKDRRKTVTAKWTGVERRKGLEKRKDWEKVSMWKSSHKPLNRLDLTKHQLLP